MARAAQVLKHHVKRWVVNKASVTNPHKKYWSASVTLGNDYNGTGDTIEKAYQSLTDRIFSTPYLMGILSQVDSFKKIVFGD